MLSVQTAGCAGMERLGVPTRTTLNSPPDDRGQYICRMHIDAAREFLGVCSEPVIRGGGSNSRHSLHQQQQSHHNTRDQTPHHHHHQHHHHQFHQHHQSSSSSSSASSLASASASSSLSTSQQPLLASGSNSISNNNSNIINNNSNSNYNNNISSMTNNTIDSNAIAKGGLETTPLKYGGNSGGSGSSGESSGFSNSSASQCSVSSHSHDHHQHYQHQLQQQKTLCCPHHVPLPDSEWIPTEQRPTQMRSSYQHSELTRSYIKPPPNKTVKDVPDRSSYNFYSSSAHSSNSGLHSLASTQSLAPSFSSSNSSSGTQSKSKPNVITKFFYRKSSPKSPNNVTSSPSSASNASSSFCSSSSSSSSSASASYSALSSSSSIASSAYSLLNSASSAGSTSSLMSSNSLTSPSAAAMVSVPLTTLPISTAATIKTTTCDYGPNMQQIPSLNVSHISVGFVPTTQLLTTIGVSHPTATTTFPHTSAMSANMEQRIPTPPLSVTVPISPAFQPHQQQQQHKQHQQQLLLDCLVGDCASVSSTLQTIKSSSCSPTLTTVNNTTAPSAGAGKDEVQQMECQSGNITRNNSSSSMQSLTATLCSCQKVNCKNCTTDAATSFGGSSSSLSVSATMSS